MKLALGQDIGEALTWCTWAANVLFSGAVGVLAGVGVLMAPGDPCKGKMGIPGKADNHWDQIREVKGQLDGWDRFVPHGVAVAVTAMLFAESWMKWCVVAVSANEDVARVYEQAVMGLLGYKAIVLVVMLAVIFVPTRVWLRGELRTLSAGRYGRRGVSLGRDVPWRVRILIVVPLIQQLVGGILWLKWQL